MGLPRKKFRTGKIAIQLDEDERKWLLGWIKSVWVAEKDMTSEDPFYEKYAYYAEKMWHLLHTGKIQNSKYSRQRQTSECKTCGREFVYLHRHVCRGRDRGLDIDIDFEACERILKQ